MALFGKPKYTFVNLVKKKDIPHGLWTRCPDCGELIYNKALKEKLKVCHKCSYHFVLGARERIELLADSFKELHSGLVSTDALNFQGPKNYKDKLAEEKKKTGLPEACIVGEALINEKKFILGVTDSRFMMGSMGSVVGEKLTRAIEQATELHLPVVIVSGSGGGARMQEGMLSLMQMAKTSAALARHAQHKLLFISILTNPTMAGIMASFASLGDVIIAEPKALIGFTGPRVIEQTIRQKLPQGFQSSEFLLKHGLIDMIVARKNLKDTLSLLLDYLTEAQT
ncbi:MAG: acetyl-CoA carboxylase carboxyltransferase subunit beta [Candidatus Omnitrophota bacterium]|nr:MAG: acetyl-CoA carboxylase carboxyltransferase subunit beta [Candidatus Omnitrophota bacterium]